MQIDMDSVPATIEEAVDVLYKSIDDEDVRFIEDNYSAAAAHHTVGRSLRNAWSLWEADSPLKRNAVDKYGIAHADDISGLILGWLFARVMKLEFDPVEHCRRCHEHWKDYGTDALSAGDWPPDRC